MPENLIIVIFTTRSFAMGALAKTHSFGDR